jgi:hypothetical protein
MTKPPMTIRIKHIIQVLCLLLLLLLTLLVPIESIWYLF